MTRCNATHGRLGRAPHRVLLSALLGSLICLSGAGCALFGSEEAPPEAEAREDLNVAEKGDTFDPRRATADDDELGPSLGSDEPEPREEGARPEDPSEAAAGRRVVDALLDIALVGVGALLLSGLVTLRTRYPRTVGLVAVALIGGTALVLR